MSSSGVRARGTDGSDFLHRERVADHYAVSAVNKSRLRLTACLHLAVSLLMVTRLLPYLLTLLKMSVPQRLAQLALPDPNAWEYAWCASILASIFGLMSLAKNRVFLIQQYIIGTIMFGFFPVVFGIYNLLDDLTLYINTKQYRSSILGVPSVILYCMFIVIALQIHIFGTYFACQLLSSWKGKRVKTK